MWAIPAAESRPRYALSAEMTGGHHEVDARVRHQVGPELGDLDAEGAVEAEGRGERRGDLGDRAGGGWCRPGARRRGRGGRCRDGPAAEHDGDVGVLEEGAGGAPSCTARRPWRGRGTTEPIPDPPPQSTERRSRRRAPKAGAGALTDGAEDEEAPETGAPVGELADAVEAEVDDLLADGVVATGVVVDGVLLAGDELLGVEELAVGAGTDLIDDSRLEAGDDRAGNVLAGAGLREEGATRASAADWQARRKGRGQEGRVCEESNGKRARRGAR